MLTGTQKLAGTHSKSVREARTPVLVSRPAPVHAGVHPCPTKQDFAPRLVITHGGPWSTPLTTQHDGATAVASRTSEPVQVANAQGYVAAEAAFANLLATPDLDLKLEPGSALYEPKLGTQARLLDLSVAAALETAYGPEHAKLGTPLLPTGTREGAPDEVDAAQAATSGNPAAQAAAAAYQTAPLAPEDAAHLFLQRLLYKINRLNLFWYDSLSNYDNERSLHLARLRNAIETAWQSWETEQLGQDTIDKIKKMSGAELKAGLQARYEADVDPPLSDVGRYISEEMGVEGYRQLLAIASLDGLTEASRQSRVCGGAPNDIMCMIFKVLMEEYGAGRMQKKHSTFFAAMMRELNLQEEPEVYLDLVPWQVLAGANHNFLMTERRRHYLRYAGGLTFFEIVGPSVYRTYLAAAKRLNLSEDAAGYWALHIKEDERHGKWMNEDVAMPLVDKYAEDGWEVVLGYDQEKSMARRAAATVLDRIRKADEVGFRGVPGKQAAPQPVAAKVA